MSQEWEYTSYSITKARKKTNDRGGYAWVVNFSDGTQWVDFNAILNKIASEG